MYSCAKVLFYYCQNFKEKVKITGKNYVGTGRIIKIFVGFVNTDVDIIFTQHVHFAVKSFVVSN